MGPFGCAAHCSPSMPGGYGWHFWTSGTDLTDAGRRHEDPNMRVTCVYAGADGAVAPQILICQNLRNNLQHPNEYIRGVTLRFLCRIREEEILEPLIPSILSNLEHRRVSHGSSDQDPSLHVASVGWGSWWHWWLFDLETETVFWDARPWVFAAWTLPQVCKCWWRAQTRGLNPLNISARLWL